MTAELDLAMHSAHLLAPESPPNSRSSSCSNEWVTAESESFGILATWSSWPNKCSVESMLVIILPEPARRSNEILRSEVIFINMLV